MSEIFDKVEQRLVNISSQNDYSSILKRFYNEAFASYFEDSSKPPILIISASDSEIVNNFVAKDLKIETSNTISPGLELRDPDNKLRVVNTVISRLVKGKDDFTHLILEKYRDLF